MEEYQKHHSSMISGKLIRTLTSESIKPLSLPRLQSDPSINPEMCLSRRDMIEVDKKKKFLHLFSTKTPRDISHILDSQCKKPSNISIPVIISDMKKWLKDRNRHPTSLKEIESLEKWLQEIVKTELPDLEFILGQKMAPDKGFIEKAESIYNVALNEVLRQVSVQCKSRAELLKHIIETLSAIWKKFPLYLDYLIEKEKKKKIDEIETLELANKARTKKMQESLEGSERLIEELKKEIKDLVEENGKLKTFISSTNWEYEEFIFYKNKKLKMESEACQTDLISDSSSEENEESSSFSNSSYSRLQISMSKSNHSISPASIHIESSELAFKNLFPKFIENLDPPLELDSSSLSEILLNYPKDPDSYFLGFKSAYDLLQQRLKASPSDPLDANIKSEPSQKQLKSKPTLTINTKFKVPLLTKKNTSRTLNDSTVLTPRDSFTVSNIIASLTSQPASKLSKFTKSSHKKISNHINYYISLAISKKYSKASKFSEFIFLKFIEKYNIKALAERKFQELVTGCLLYYQENPKFAWFLRAIHAGKTQDLNDLSQEGAEMLVKLYEFMITSRIGVLPDSANPLQNRLFPYLRALECIRCKFECVLSKSEYASVIEQVNKQLVSDPSTINKAGLVDLDKFVDSCMEVYEKYVQRIKTGAILCIKIITDYNYLTKGQICLILRHLCPHKYIQLLKYLTFDEQNLLSKESFIDSCVVFGVLSSSVVSEFFAGYEKNVRSILEFIDLNENEIMKLAKDNEEGLAVDEWENYLFDLKVKLKCQDLTRYLQLWHVLKKEIEYFMVDA